jgi:hypothetical protein
VIFYVAYAVAIGVDRKHSDPSCGGILPLLEFVMLRMSGLWHGRASLLYWQINCPGVLLLVSSCDGSRPDSRHSGIRSPVHQHVMTG